MGADLEIDLGRALKDLPWTVLMVGEGVPKSWGGGAPFLPGGSFLALLPPLPQDPWLQV